MCKSQPSQTPGTNEHDNDGPRCIVGKREPKGTCTCTCSVLSPHDGRGFANGELYVNYTLDRGIKIPRQLAQGTYRLQAADEIQFALNSNDAGSRSSHLLLTERRRPSKTSTCRTRCPTAVERKTTATWPASLRLATPSLAFEMSSRARIGRSICHGSRGSNLVLSPSRVTPSAALLPSRLSGLTVQTGRLAVFRLRARGQDGVCG
jgi:hypothetical protein